MRPQRDPLTDEELLLAEAVLEVFTMAPPGVRVARTMLFALGEHHREASDRAALRLPAPAVEHGGVTAPPDGAPESQRAGAPPRALGSPSPYSDKSPLRPPVLAPAMFDADTCPHDSAEPDGDGGAICNGCGSPVVGHLIDGGMGTSVRVDGGPLWMPDARWTLADDELPCGHCVAGLPRESCYRHGDPVLVVTARAAALAAARTMAPARPLPRPELLIDIIDPSPGRPTLSLHLRREVDWLGGIIAPFGGAEPREGAAMVLADRLPCGCPPERPITGWFGTPPPGWKPGDPGPHVCELSLLFERLSGRLLAPRPDSGFVEMTLTLPAPQPDSGSGRWDDEAEPAVVMPDQAPLAHAREFFEAAVVVPLLTPEQVRRMNGPEGDRAAREAIAELEVTNPAAAAWGRAFEAAGRRPDGQPRIAAVPALVPDPAKHRPRALCPVCKTDRPVGKGGRLQSHQTPGSALRCAGSAVVVDEAAAKAAAQAAATKAARPPRPKVAMTIPGEGADAEPIVTGDGLDGA